jgi:hypothetical protein
MPNVFDIDAQNIPIGWFRGGMDDAVHNWARVHGLCSRHLKPRQRRQAAANIVTEWRIHHPEWAALNPGFSAVRNVEQRLTCNLKSVYQMFMRGFIETVTSWMRNLPPAVRWSHVSDGLADIRVHNMPPPGTDNDWEEWFGDGREDQRLERAFYLYLTSQPMLARIWRFYLDPLDPVFLQNRSVALFRPLNRCTRTLGKHIFRVIRRHRFSAVTVSERHMSQEVLRFCDSLTAVLGSRISAQLNPYPGATGRKYEWLIDMIVVRPPQHEDANVPEIPGEVEGDSDDDDDDGNN